MSNTKLLYECSSPFDNKPKFRNDAFKIEDISKSKKLKGWKKIQERFLTKKLKPVSNEMVILETKPKEILLPEIETVNMLSLPKPLNLVNFKSNQVLIKKKHKKPIIELENVMPLRIKTLNEVPDKIDRNIPFETTSVISYALDNNHFNQRPKNQNLLHDKTDTALDNFQPRYIYMQSNKPIIHSSEIEISSRNLPQNQQNQQPCIVYNIIQDPNNYQQPIKTYSGQPFEYSPQIRSTDFRGMERNFIEENHEIIPELNSRKYNITQIEEHSTLNEMPHFNAQSIYETRYFSNTNCPSFLLLSLLAFMLLLLQGILFGLIISESKLSNQNNLSKFSFFKSKFTENSELPIKCNNH
jgi:hypothetical protein